MQTVKRVHVADCSAHSLHLLLSAWLHRAWLWMVSRKPMLLYYVVTHVTPQLRQLSPGTAVARRCTRRWLISHRTRCCDLTHSERREEPADTAPGWKPVWIGMTHPGVQQAVIHVPFPIDSDGRHSLRLVLCRHLAALAGRAPCPLPALCPESSAAAGPCQPGGALPTSTYSWSKVRTGLSTLSSRSWHSLDFCASPGYDRFWNVPISRKLRATNLKLRICCCFWVLGELRGISETCCLLGITFTDEKRGWIFVSDWSTGICLRIRFIGLWPGLQETRKPHTLTTPSWHLKLSPQQSLLAPTSACCSFQGLQRCVTAGAMLPCLSVCDPEWRYQNKYWWGGWIRN